MLANFPLVAAITANLFAQLVKVPLHLILNKEFKPSMALSTGGMPSSHSATVSALTTGVAMVDGLHSTTFAIALVLTSIVSYDAMGVRRHAGSHAEVLNLLLKDLKNMMVISTKHPLTNETYNTKFKELLGHEPLEVLFGLITGVIVTLVLGAIIN